MFITKLFLITAVLSISLFSRETNTTIPAIVPLHWLQQNYNNKHLVIIDVRDKTTFQKAHLKQAINMPVFQDLFDKNYMIPKLDKLQTLFSNAGIDDQSLIVVYGNRSPIWAARFYWISEVLGHDKVGILKKGYGNWKKNTLPITTKTYVPKKTNFVPKVNNSKIETQLSTLVSIGKKNNYRR